MLSIRNSLSKNLKNGIYLHTPRFTGIYEYFKDFRFYVQQ